jgi:spermidine synthase
VFGSTISVMEPIDACRDSIVRRLREGTYDKPFIVDTDARRCLHFDFDALQSAMLVASPSWLALTYTRQMMSFLVFNASPERVLLLGLGGGSLAKFCYRYLSQATLVNVEIDPRVICLRDEFQIPPDNAQFKVLCEDAARYVEHAPESADVILMDAVGRNETNALFKDITFYQALHRALTPDGILVMNMYDGMLDWTERLAQVGEVFRNEYLYLRAHAEGNLVLLAFKTRREFSWDQLGVDALRLQAVYGLDFPAFAKQMGMNWRRRERWKIFS